MNELQIFQNEDFGQIRVTMDEAGNPLFVAADVCRALDLSNTIVALDRLDEDEKYKLNLGLPGGDTNCVTEAGLYSMVLGSRKKEAKAFKRWVTHEVIPSIRKHGAYMTPETLEKALLSPDFLIQLAQELKKEQELRRTAEYNAQLLELDNRRLRPKADYFDDLVDKNLLTSLRETAKLFRVREKKLIQFLLDNRFLYRAPSGKLLPYATQPADQLFVVKESMDDRTGWVGTQTFVTPRGRETFRLLLRGSPESELWGRNDRETPKEMSEADRYRMEEFYQKRAKEKRKKNK